MPRFPRVLTIAAFAALALPASASAAIRGGSIQDPQGDASALSGPALDIQSFSTTYDDVAGTLKMTWTYFQDVREVLPNGQSGGAASAGNPTTPGVPTDYATIQWRAKKESGEAFSAPTTLQLYGVSGQLSGIGAVSADGQTVSAEFTNASLVGHDWQRAFGSSGNGDDFERFWFDGFGEPAPSYPTPTPITPSSNGGGGTPPVGSDPGSGAAGPSTGMSIDNGAQFTNDPNVTLAVVAPAGTAALRVANDGGFLKARQFPVARSIKWRLEESGSERLPKTVYLRFGSQSQTFTDDIILDQTKPVLASAAVIRNAATRSAQPRAAKSTTRSLRVRVSAKDATSGVGNVQFAVRKSRPLKASKYARVVTIKTRSTPRFVRVQDRAGNYSLWRKIR